MSRFRLAAEWAPQGSVLMAWPQPDSDWAALANHAEPTFTAIARAILAEQDLTLCVSSERQAVDLQQRLVCATDQGRLHTVVVATNDTWARDFGPLALSDGAEWRLLDATFNGWGNKFPADRDNAANHALHAQGALGSLPLESDPLVVEGGALETDGEGTLLVNRPCVLNPNRGNPEPAAERMTQWLHERLGAERILWLDNGHLDGDDTDGHIDTLARFAGPEHIVYQACDNPRDSHYAELQAMARELAAHTDGNGQPYRLTALPWPDPVHDDEGNRLPATYANFLITSHSVLVPCYDVAQDDEACRVIAGCFPQRRVQGIQCRPLIHQGGSLHCLTMQLPPGAVPDG
ncbi:agmatine deiminase [Halovibrio salipaludis]|uniref:Agmatine deiminase n=1 Tax=Halovibrio salipaludis TaxID=2032626 RepID=A0A2A2F9L3_9GAMM|nr:agmatine deiminase family protein [Halovibrio salipaludis]PAU81243.1 agmatine deiminase [Halovibrio salipaludis]